MFGIFCFAVMGVLLWLVFPKIELWTSANKIGVVEVRGIIRDVQKQLQDIKKFRQDQKIKAILLRIESPGGGVGPSQELYREIRRTIKEKPVVASLGGVAASGGYYIASSASHIVANPGTITGSIGVVLPFPNLQGLFEKLGYKKTIIQSGPFKDMGNPGREMTPQEKELLQETVDAVHRQFVRHVCQGRNLPQKDIEQIADGRILTGEMAQKLALVDELGNFEDAVKAAANLAKIEGEPKLVYAGKKRRSLLEFLLGCEWDEKMRSYLGDSRYVLPHEAFFLMNQHREVVE
jgi:protease-4